MIDTPGGSSTVVPIIPMKPLAEGNSRLGRQFNQSDRGDLIAGLLLRVIAAIRGASIGLFWVIGGDERIMRLVRNHDGIWLPDTGRNLNDTLSKAFIKADQENYSSLYLPGDLPFIKPSDVINLIRSSRNGNYITLAPARSDGGTNGILVPQNINFQPGLGQRSYAKHLAKAAKMEISVAICYSPGLGFDLDTVDDLEKYEHMEPGLLNRLVPTWHSQK